MSSNNLYRRQALDLLSEGVVGNHCVLRDGLVERIATMMRESSLRRLELDRWDRPLVYYATWQTAAAGNSFGIFDRLEPAIFFVVSMLGSEVDWASFPDPSRKYPYEERNGKPGYSPVFRVEREAHGRPVTGYIYQMAVARDWTAGNGIADAAKTYYHQVTGKYAEIAGTGDSLSAKVG